MSAYDSYGRLESYLKKVEDETSKEVKIVESRDLGIEGMLSAFRYNPDSIIIIIKAGADRSKKDLIRSIAHEATHGVLIFKMGYCRLDFKQEVPDQIIKNARLLFTMLDDIVVNKIIQDNGFSPFGSEYIPSVKREIKAALNGENIYLNYSRDVVFDQVLMISRYVIAWAFLEYYNLENHHQEILNEFLRAFQKSFAHDYKLANKITRIISKHDIFNPEGHKRIIFEILSLWGWQETLNIKCPL